MANWVSDYANLCASGVACAVAEKAEENVQDSKKALLQLYDALPITKAFREVDEKDFYELTDKVYGYFIYFLGGNYIDSAVFRLPA